MGSEWTTVGEIAQVFDGPHATPKKIDDGPYFLSISSLEQGKLDLSKSAHIIEEQFVKWTKRVTPEAGDVLFSYETRLGEAALMPAGIKACLGRRMGLLRPDREKVDPHYLLFAYLGPDFQREIFARTNTGATVDRIALKELPSFPIRIPSLSEQKKIASILGSLDKKIELNRQINTTLESMAQALFKSWFVDFDPVIDNALAAGNSIPEPFMKRAQARALKRQEHHAAAQATQSANGSTDASPLNPLPAEIQQLFPSSFVFTEEMGLVPEGWELSTLGSICERSGGKIQTGPFGSQLHASDYVGQGISVVMPKDLKNRRVIEATTAKIDDENAERLSRHCLKVGDIIFSRRGDVEKHALIGAHEVDWICGTGCLLVRPGKKWVSPSYISFSLDQAKTKAWLTQHAVGATMPNLNTGILSEVPVTLPESKLLVLFEQHVGINEERISVGNLIAESLTTIRDQLLPKLLSGQLQIPEAEQQLAEVI